jgi:hypothetical protein
MSGKISHRKEQIIIHERDRILLSDFKCRKILRKIGRTVEQIREYSQLYIIYKPTITEKRELCRRCKKYLRRKRGKK